jgi:hypothetical protein
MTEQQTNWLEEESKQFTSTATYEELPSLKLQPNVIADLTIDFSKPFQVWTGENNGKTVTKKIIPVVLAGQRMVWWLNTKNPIYKEIITAGKNGVTQFKVLQTGTQQSTKYVLVK